MLQLTEISSITRYSLKIIFSITILLVNIIAPRDSVSSELKYYQAISPHFGSKIDTNSRLILIFQYESESASSYFDVGGEIRDRLEVDDVALEGIDYFRFDYAETRLTARIFYKAFDNLELFCAAPIRISSLDEEYKARFADVDPETGEVYYSQYYTALVEEFSDSRVERISAGANFAAKSGANSTILSAEVRVPTGFHKSVLLDSTNEFLSDGAFEFLIGPTFVARIGEVQAFTSARYVWRGEELADMVSIFAGAGFSTVPDTRLSFYSNIGLSLKSFNQPIAFNARQTPAHFNYVDLGARFDMNLFESYAASFSYDVRLYGKNTFNSSIFSIALAYLIR